MKKENHQIVYVPEPDQRTLEQLVQDIISNDVIARNILVASLVKRYNELRKVKSQQADKIIQIDGR